MPTDPPADISPRTRIALALAWLAVGLPLAWGVATTITKALALFR